MTPPRNRTLIHLLAVLAMLVNVLLPGWAHAARHGGMAGQAGDLCLSTASSADAARADAVTGSNPDPTSHLIATDPCCLVCLTHAGGPLLPGADTPTIPAPQPGAHTLPHGSPLASLGAVWHDAYAARAPPAA
ncbi:MAG: hypothetical protein RLY71_3964 [Pseudomonadota bacterium]|jgi:hypothetical protein